MTSDLSSAHPVTRVQIFIKKNISYDSASPCYADPRGGDIQSKFRLQIRIPRFHKPPPTKFCHPPPHCKNLNFCRLKLGFIALCAAPVRENYCTIFLKFLSTNFKFSYKLCPNFLSHNFFEFFWEIFQHFVNVS